MVPGLLSRGTARHNRPTSPSIAAKTETPRYPASAMASSHASRTRSESRLFSPPRTTGTSSSGGSSSRRMAGVTWPRRRRGPRPRPRPHRPAHGRTPAGSSPGWRGPGGTPRCAAHDPPDGQRRRPVTKVGTIVQPPAIVHSGGAAGPHPPGREPLGVHRPLPEGEDPRPPKLSLMPHSVQPGESPRIEGDRSPIRRRGRIVPQRGRPAVFDRAVANDGRARLDRQAVASQVVPAQCRHSERRAPVERSCGHPEATAVLQVGSSRRRRQWRGLTTEKCRRSSVASFFSPSRSHTAMTAASTRPRSRSAYDARALRRD